MKKVLMILLFLASAATYAQKITITGTVTDSQGAGLPGATVQVRGTNQGALTGTDGKYSIEVTSADVTLVFSFVGYTPKEMAAQGQTVVNVILSEDVKGLEEVVVVGYGTQKKLNLTAAVDQVTSERLENRPVANVTQGLQGVMPNLNIRVLDGKPIQAPSYNIRGTTSIGQGGSALVLIDGVEGDPSLLNPNDIASVSILKDAASASIYGARGAFGVVLITTKNPTKGRTSVTVSSNFAVKQPIGVPDFVTDGYTYARMFSEAFVNGDGSFPQNVNKTQKFSQAYLDAFRAKVESGQPYNEVEIDPATGEYVYFASTDYYDALYKDNTLASDNNVTITGSGDKTTFLLSGRYMTQNGLFTWNTDDYSMVNFRAKGSIQVTPWLIIDNNTDYSQMNYHNPLNVGEGSGIWRNIGDEGHPTLPLFNPDGTITMSSVYTVGDFWYGKNGIDTKRGVFKNTTGFTSQFFNNTFRIKGDFTFRSTQNNSETKRVQVPYSNKPGTVAYVGTTTNDLAVDQRETQYIATNLYSEYENTFGGSHYVKVLLGYNYEQSTYNRLATQRNGVIYEDATDMNLALGQSIVTGGGYEKWVILGGFSRINYAFKDRYLLELNARYDGSSKFPADQRFAFFPSVSGGWRLSKESFWNVSPKIISDIKLRASYGSLGNGNINSYVYQEQFSISQASYILNGVRPQRTNNPSVLPDGITWETSTTTDIGLDFAMLSDRLRFVGDYYIRNTTDMYTIGLTLPQVFGATPPKGNYADLQTKGWELTLTWRDKFNVGSKPLNYSFRFTLADNKAEITRYNNPDKLLSDYYEGQTIGEIWGYTTEGFFIDQADVDSHAKQSPQMRASPTNLWFAGDIKLKDMNGDGFVNIGTNRVSDPGDRSIIGNSAAHYNYSATFEADWNNIFFSAFFQGVGKQQWYPSVESESFWGQYNRPYNNVPIWHLGNMWTPENINAYLPRTMSRAASNNTSRELGVVQTKYLQNIAYLRLKNLQLGYNLPKQWVSKIGASDLRVYVSGENIWTWSPLYDIVGKGHIDVENTGPSDQVFTSGNAGDGYNYPMLSSFSFGLNVTF
ncbi:MAG: TonB-dependent receptor [Bacteroidales bacterium]|jgi:TonB-linked SusC/RagA family outer membrane protein|nr:TonB-dependent receptor [Bacteroidales bacterium]